MSLFTPKIYDTRPAKSALAVKRTRLIQNGLVTMKNPTGSTCFRSSWETHFMYDNQHLPGPAPSSEIGINFGKTIVS